MSEAKIEIKVGKEKVWAALTDPGLVKKYLFGTEMVTTWKVGDPISYKGEWQGKAYHDKGVVKEFKVNERIVSSYWSGLTGLVDSPENYQEIVYELQGNEKITSLIIIQKPSEAQKKEGTESPNHWGVVLESMKKLLEEG